MNRQKLRKAYQTMDLQEIYDSTLSELEISVQQRDHGFRTIQIGTFSIEGPKVRSVILRHLEKNPLKLYFHTALDSEKIIEITNDARTAAHAYCPKLKKQIRFGGISRVLQTGQIYEQIVQKMSASAKALYGRQDNFRSLMAVIEFTPTEVDVLWLRADGHLRLKGAYIDDEVSLRKVRV